MYKSTRDFFLKLPKEHTFSKNSIIKLITDESEPYYTHMRSTIFHFTTDNAP